jgi:hypothetical protein
MQKSSYGGREFPQIFEDMLRRLTNEDLEMFAVVTRKIWLRRNELVHGGVFAHPTQVWKEAEEALQEFQRINKPSGQSSNDQQTTKAETWKAPLMGIVKFNWDATLNQKNKTIGLGIIAWDHRGQFLIALSKQ